MAKLAVAEKVEKRVRKSQFVWEGVWSVLVDDREETITQLIAAKNFQAAFFKARTWAKDNVLDTGWMKSLSQKEGMVV